MPKYITVKTDEYMAVRARNKALEAVVDAAKDVIDGWRCYPPEIRPVMHIPEVHVKYVALDAALKALDGERS